MSDDTVDRAQALLEQSDHSAPDEEGFDVDEANERLAAADQALDGSQRNLEEGAMSAFRAGQEVPESYTNIDGYKDGILIDGGMAIMNENGRVSIFKGDLSNQMKLTAESAKALRELLTRN